jgi:CRP-like cAMP-binding protein
MHPYKENPSMKPHGLADTKIFQGLAPEDLAAIEKICEEVFYCYDTELAYDGVESKYVYLVKEGKTELVAKHPKTGQKVVIATKGPGDTMGFSSLIQPYQMTFIIRCLDDCRLYRIPRARLLQELKRRPELFETLRHRFAKLVFPSLEKALDRLKQEEAEGSWYPHEGDMGSSGPEEGEVV